MISGVIPYRPQPGREQNFDTVHAWMSDYCDEVIVADDAGQQFSRAGSINAGVAESSGDLLVVCDADLVVPYDQLDDALLLAKQGAVVLPFTEYWYYGGRASVKLRDAGPVGLDREWVMKGSVGGVFVATRDVFNRVGGMDPAFRGWGFEDNAFCCAAETFAEVVRVDGPIHHLFHPVDGDRPETNRARADRYLAAVGDKDAMAGLVGARC